MSVPETMAVEAAQDCDQVTVEPTFSFENVTIESCDVSPTSATPETSIGVTAAVRNGNDQPATADVVWAARDLPNGPIVARFNDLFIPIGNTVTIQEFFVPNDTQSIVDTVGEDATWTSVIEAVLVPGTVEPAAAASGTASAPGFGLSGIAEARSPEDITVLATDGGCECGGAQATTVAPRVDRGTLMVGAAGAVAGVTAGLLRR